MPVSPLHRIRNERGGITPAEGCMFAAVGLFVILLLGILYVAFVRFGSPPPPTPLPEAPAALLRPQPAAIGLLPSRLPLGPGIALVRVAAETNG